jgi:hypothetical protein
MTELVGYVHGATRFTGERLFTKISLKLTSLLAVRSR